MRGEGEVVTSPPRFLSCLTIGLGILRIGLLVSLSESVQDGITLDALA